MVCFRSEGAGRNTIAYGIKGEEKTFLPEISYEKNKKLLR